MEKRDRTDKSVFCYFRKKLEPRYNFEIEQQSKETHPHIQENQKH